jgi:2'-5' RNA ligase
VKGKERQRVFVALEIGAEPRGALAALQNELRRVLPGARLVRPEAWHVTLAFLGSLPCTQVEAVRQALVRGPVGAGPIEGGLRGLGAFPDARRARVVWVGVEDGGGGIARLHADVRRILVAHGLEQEDRPFHAHVTLARLDRRPPASLGPWLTEHAATGFGRTTFAEIVLFESELGPGGARHQALERVALAAAPVL